jgi:hypothetical protein
MKTTEILEKETISTREVKLLMRRANNGEKIDLSKFWNNEVKLEDPKQGYDWLMNLWKTPNGKERKNNPFGYREEKVLENFSHIEFRGFYNAGNYNHNFYVPLWVVIGNETSFEYYMSGGKINIVG